MPELDSSEDLARLPAVAPRGVPGSAHAHGPSAAAVALAARGHATGAPAPQPPLPQHSSSANAAGPESGGRALALARGFDVICLALATAPALLLGAPALGYLIGAGAWLGQRALASYDRRWIRSAREPRAQLGLNLAEAFARIWLLAGAIIAAGVIGGRADGLTAALVIFAAYSVAFAVRVLSGPPQRRNPR